MNRAGTTVNGHRPAGWSAWYCGAGGWWVTRRRLLTEPEMLAGLRHNVYGADVVQLCDVLVAQIETELADEPAGLGTARCARTGGVVVESHTTALR